MAINFINDHGSAGLDISQDGTYFASIRYTKLYGYIISFEDDSMLEIHELEKILSKMKELQREVNNG